MNNNQRAKLWATRWGFAAFAAVTMLGAARTLLAQTGVDLLAKPWTTDASYEIDEASALIQAPGHESSDNGRFQLDQLQSDGRMRLGVPNVADGQRIFFAGYDVNDLNFSAHGPALPDRMFDGSVAAGMPLGKVDDYLVAVSAGIGYAGDNPLAQRNAVYGQGDLIVARDLGQERYLAVVLDYNGNRLIAPDLPLPGVGYRATWGDRLSYVAGFPYSYIQWRPLDALILSAQAELTTGVKGSIDYQLFKQVGLFAAYSQEAQAAHIDDQPYDRRLFFQGQRAEVGVHYVPCEHCEFNVAGGYAWDQRFYRGFDLQNLDWVSAVSDVPYARVSATIRF